MIFNTKAIKEEYFKYNYKDWTRPNLAANGTVGSDNYAVRASSTYGSESPYKAFNGNINDNWSANSGDGGKGTFIEFYSPVKINVTSLEFTNRSSYIRVWHKFNVLGSNDGIDYKILGEFINENATANATWKIDVNTGEAVKYIKIIGLDTGIGSHDTMGIKEIKIFGREYVNTVPGTSTDYDVKKTNGGFIKDIYINGKVLNFFNYEDILILNKYPSIKFLSKDQLQTYLVPDKITRLQIECVASRGFTGAFKGGLGGKVECILKVTPKQSINIFVGAIPLDEKTNSYNASDIRINGTAYENRVIVAGGGGNSSSITRDSGDGFGGAGGGLIGGTGGNVTRTRGGEGGTQTEGGAGGTRIDTGAGYNGSKGGFGLGAKGGGGSTSGGGTAYAGAGGAGWYGGGSGAVYEYWGWSNAGGGGGSSYTNNTLCSNVVHTQGFNEGEGYVIITPLP